MSADRKRQLRIQGGAFCSPTESSQNRKPQNKDRRLPIRLANKNQQSSKNPEVSGAGISDHGHQNRSPNKNNQSTIEHEFCYEENSHYNFQELEKKKRPEEIQSSGVHEMSVTENGLSRIIYEPTFLDSIEGYTLFSELQNEIEWEDRNVVIRGVERQQPRQVAWFGPLPYLYSGLHLEPKEIPDRILQVKEKVENYLAHMKIPVKLNSVLANHYRDGRDSVAWHSDDELSMRIQPTIASLSLGEVRTFEMRKKPLKRNDDSPADRFIKLKHGSLLIMDGQMQKDWEHRVPKENSSFPRINLTFRTIHAGERY